MRAINEVKQLMTFIERLETTTKTRIDTTRYEAIKRAKIAHWYTTKCNLIDFNYLFNIW